MTKNIFIISFVVTSFISCGPRTGIHEEQKVDTPTCGVADNPNLTISPQTLSEENGRKIFKLNCAVCHAFSDQKLIGPGFKGLLDRLPGHSDYFKKYVTNSDSLVKASDPYSLKLQAEYDYNFVHKADNYNNSLSSKDIDDLVSFIKIIGRPIP